MDVFSLSLKVSGGQVSPYSVAIKLCEFGNHRASITMVTEHNPCYTFSLLNHQTSYEKHVSI